MNNRLRSSIFILFFFSGFCALVYEVIWVRMLTLVISTAALAVTIVLSSFMAGLALGSFYFGRFIDRGKSPLKVYACLNIGVGIYVFLFPFILSRFQNIYIAFHQHFQMTQYLSNPIRFLISFILLLLPTTLMGGTLPVMSKLLVKREDRLGWDVGSLYSVNTFGGVLGCFLTGFFLIWKLGVNETLRLSASLNILIGLIAFTLNRNFALSQERETKTTTPPTEEGESYSNWILRLVLWVFALSGLAALAYEVFWTRIFVIFLGHTVYAFSAMLTAFLCGLAIGAWLFAKFIDKRTRPLLVLGWLEISIGLTAILTLILCRKFTYLVNILQPIMIIGAPSPYRGLLAKFIISFLLMLPVTILIGGAFPVVSKIYTRNLKKVGEKIGGIYSANTIGAIFGSIVAGFALIPLVGLQKGVVYIALLNMFLGVFLLLASPLIRYRTKAVLLTCFLLVTFSSITLFPTKPIVTLTDIFIKRGRPELLYYKEGVSGTVSVIRTGGGEDINTILLIDGLSTCGSNTKWNSLVGHLSLLFHLNPKKILLVGLGGGYTLETIAKYDVEQIECVEISPDVLDAFSYFPRKKADLLKDPKIKIIIDDGRHYISTTQKKYDIVITDAFLTLQTGQGILDTTDYQSSVLDILEEGGYYCQMLGPVGEHLKTKLRTVASIFPHVVVWKFQDDDIVFIFATKTELRIDQLSVTKRYEKKNIKNDLAKWDIKEPSNLFDSFVMGNEEIRKYAGNAKVSTDNRPFIDFNAIDLVYGWPVSTSEDMIEFSEYKSSLTALVK